ncbi:MAG: selenide, water dikinase SelD [Cyanobacteriota bacterium]
MTGKAAHAPAREHLVLAGGGHTHALVLRQWVMRPQRRPTAWITLVNRRSTALYSGMVPGLVAGLYSREACSIDLRRLADRAGVSFVEAEINGLDLAARELLLGGRPPLRFDWLSLDVGAVVASELGVEYQRGTRAADTLCDRGEDDTRCGVGFGERLQALPVKPLEPLLEWCFSGAGARTVRVQGSGAAAVELALALQARGLQPELCTKASGIALGSRSANRLLHKVLEQAGIAVLAPGSALPREGAAQAAQDGKPQSPPPAAAVIRCTGSRGPAWLGASGLPVDERGRVRTANTLQVEGHPRLFAAGDCGVVASDPRPPSGVWAVRAAPLLDANLARAMRGRPLSAWYPQQRALQLFGDGGVNGPPRALALWGPLALGPSRWLWRWKDHIDQAFMRRFRELPAMGGEQGAMACRGCAAKLGAAPLAAALARLAPEGHLDAGKAHQAEDAAVVGHTSGGELLLQSVDGFPALVSDPWLNGRLTALHACSDLWASGAHVTTAQVVVTLPAVGADLQAELLHQSLAGVRSVLDPLGAALVGGHTLEARDAMAAGPDRPSAGLALALTVNGAVPEQGHWPKGPLRVGDALVLTRPIGTGVLFAAAMAAAARPGWLDQALAVMQQSQADLVALLGVHGCHACTDITGFGLLGHLGEMLGSSTAASPAQEPLGTQGPPSLQVTLNADAVPALPGALELLEAGYASTLAPSNARALALLDRHVALVGSCASQAGLQALLIDPQTCGPLLAAVPGAQAAAAVAALHAAGYGEASVVGSVAAAMPG